MIHIVKKSYFTLLELLIVIFIMSFGAILTGVKIKEVYQEQRFLSESQQVLSHLAMAQDLMLIMDTDVHFKMAKDPDSKQIFFWLQLEKPLEKGWDRFVERKVKLSMIQSYEFNESNEEELSIEFSLGHMSQGMLILFEGKKDDTQRSNKRTFEIELLGYPTSLTAKSPEAKPQKKAEKSQLLYPAEVYEKLYADRSEQNPTS